MNPDIMSDCDVMLAPQTRHVQDLNDWMLSAVNMIVSGFILRRYTTISTN